MGTFIHVQTNMGVRLLHRQESNEPREVKTVQILSKEGAGKQSDSALLSPARPRVPGRGSKAQLLRAGTSQKSLPHKARALRREV